MSGGSGIECQRRRMLKKGERVVNRRTRTEGACAQPEANGDRRNGDTSCPKKEILKPNRKFCGESGPVHGRVRGGTLKKNELIGYYEANFCTVSGG